MKYAFLSVEADKYHRVDYSRRYTAAYHGNLVLVSKGRRKILCELRIHSEMVGYTTSLVGSPRRGGFLTWREADMKGELRSAVFILEIRFPHSQEKQ